MATGPPTARQEQTRRSREAILAAARAVVAERPFAQVSVGAVMERTEMTRPAFYRHFADLPALLLALVGDVATRLQEVGVAWATSPTYGPLNARRHLGALVDVVADDLPLIRALLEAARQDEQVAAMRRSVDDQLCEAMAAGLRLAVQRGEIDGMDEEQVARAMVALLQAYVPDALADGVSRERVAEAVWTIWVRTLGLDGRPERPRGG